MLLPTKVIRRIIGSESVQEKMNDEGEKSGSKRAPTFTKDEEELVLTILTKYEIQICAIF